METATPQRRFTPQDLLRLPEHKGTELVNGQFVEKASSVGSARVSTDILFRLYAELGRAGAFEVHGMRLGYRCFADDPDRIRRPNISAIRKERLKDIPRDVDFMPIPPDLAVEVLAPTVLAYESSGRTKEYLDAGFGQVWVVDPNVKTVAIYSSKTQGRVLREADEIDGGEVLPGFRCRVSELFGRGGI